MKNHGKITFWFYEYVIENWFLPDDPHKQDYLCPSGSSSTSNHWTVTDYEKVIKQDTALVKNMKNDYGFTGGILPDVKV